MPNLSALEPFTTSATALANLVLVSPQTTVGYQPQNPTLPDGSPNLVLQPVPALLFNYEGEQSVQIESDITDHFVEDNTAIEDQIALKPEIITAHGFIGELNDIPPNAVLAILKKIADKLTVISAYTPQLSTTAQLAYNEAFFLYQVAANVANSAVSAWDALSNAVTGSSGQSVIGSGGLTAASNQNKQQVMFQKLYGYWRERRLFTVQTPWAVFENMALLKFRAIQDESTRVITDFELTFKMIRTTSTTAGTNAVSFSGQAAQQAAGLNDLGVASPNPSTSLLDGIAAMS